MIDALEDLTAAKDLTGRWRWVVRCDLCAVLYATDEVHSREQPATPTAREVDAIRHEACSRGWSTMVIRDADDHLVLFDVCPFCCNPPS
jgi:hypothetical protein